MSKTDQQHNTKHQKLVKPVFARLATNEEDSFSIQLDRAGNNFDAKECELEFFAG
jgi:hypothetical protein